MTYFGRERAMENKFNSMKTGLVTGIAGQDGSYLAELLLAKGYRVVGAVRNVVATGETHSVRELCEIAFGHLGLDYRDYVQEDAAAYRPTESVRLVGNSEKARKQLGWAPEVEFREMVGMMVDTDLRKLIEQDKVDRKGQGNV